jgi:hypothetical protein
MTQALSMLSVLGVITAGGVVGVPRELERRQQEQRLARPAEVEEQTAKASEEYETAREKAEAACRDVMEDFEEARIRGGLIGVRETAKVRSLTAFLASLRELGEKVMADEATFKAAFDQFHWASAAVAMHYRDSAELFRRHAAKAEFEETKATYQKAADWYEARAKQAKHEASLKYPTDFESEQRRLKEFVASVGVLEETVKRDPASFREQPKGLEDLVAFEAYYRKLGEVLQKNTSQILERLPSEARAAR